MEDKIKKCSSNKHSDKNAISYCQSCDKYLCNKCQSFHSELFENHIISSPDKKEKEIFTNICEEDNHHIKMDFFCKTHNILCCSSCICKIKNDIYGKHRDCDICLLKDIIDDKKNNLKDNIILLENISENLEKSIEKLKITFDKINDNKEELKLKIQKIFTKIRNALNDREDKILLEIDDKFDNTFIKENFINEIKKMPTKIKSSLARGKIIEKNWKQDNINSLINDCLIIENNIKEINKINDEIKKCDSNEKIKIDINIEENEINDFIENIKKFGEIINKDLLYSDFSIGVKEPIYKLKYHSGNVLALTVLNDGRLVSGSRDSKIIIYNSSTYKPDLIIKEHEGGILCISLLSTGLLASCSDDKTIKIFKIKGLEYEIVQTLKYHSDSVLKIIELKNKKLVSSSSDSSIIFYNKDKSQYKNEFKISTNGTCSSIIQTKDNEICYSEYNDNKICFFDFTEKKTKAFISNISKRNYTDEWFLIINKELMVIPGENILTIVNILTYKISKIIKVPESIWNLGICKINDNMILTGDRAKTLRQWKIEGNNLTLISKKENAHDGDINYLLNLKNGQIASGSDGGTVKIW